MIKNIITLTVGLFSLSCFADTPQAVDFNKTTGAGTWSISRDGVHFSLTQILPEQAKAFYVNRGFTLQQIEPYISSCVYMAVLRNDNAAGTIHFISKNWPVQFNGKPHSLLPVNEWVKKLTTKTTKQSSLVAFRWAQFPPEQEYEPGGDWNQGMLSIGLPASSQFTITARWDIKGKAYEATLQGVQCAK